MRVFYLLAGKLILAFDEKPGTFLLGIFRSDKIESSHELFSGKHDSYMSFLESLAYFLAIFFFVSLVVGRYVSASIPYERWTCSVLSFRDHAFEILVFERMVFYHHREPFIVRIHAWTFGNRPAFQYSVKLQPEIVMQVGSIVQMHHKNERVSRIALRASGLFRFGKIPLFLVFFEHKTKTYEDSLFGII